MTPPYRTLPHMFEESVARFASNIMMWEKRGESYEGATYSEIRRSVHECAAGLMDMGIRKGDRLALISEGRNDWVISELGILYAGAINVPLSVKIEELSDLRFRLAHSGCRALIVSGLQAGKIRQVKRDLPELETIVVLDGDVQRDQDEIPFAEVLEMGKKFLKFHRDEFETRWTSVHENDPANICYTSGTTADPKGIILTHRNYTANVEQASATLPIPEWYMSLLLLPWDHAFAHTAGVYTLMKNGASMASVKQGKTPLETLKNVPGNIRETRPTFLMSVPALAKNFRKNIENGIREKGPAIEKLFRKALDLAYAYNGIGWDRGKNASLTMKLQYKFFDFLIFRKIRANFGGRLEFFIGGGALLDIELQRFFYAIGIPMYQGYGLTEAAPIISDNVPARHKLGSSGSIIPNLEVKICDEEGKELPIGRHGEIVVRGENVMAGYWKNERATREALRDGWLFTGDLGYLDGDNFLYVLGRAKSLLIAHDGEKYSPEGIEEAIVGNSRSIDQMMLFNEQSPFTIALVVPNKEVLLQHLKEKNLSTASDEGQEAALKFIEKDIAQFKPGGIFAGEFPERWLPSAVAVLGEGFTEQNHFLNSTLKMVRGKITEFYRDRIDFIFTPQGKDICNAQNRVIIKRLG
ncbi:MAG: long-chain fatty acid--CoA ligase [Ignavibacteria bacterium GWA2_54_16]|nr:MAG: long-chain fatty acid--CoA ligase [Ignavibacteria bacterium GWA2_54_16]